MGLRFALAEDDDGNRGDRRSDDGSDGDVKGNRGSRHQAAQIAGIWFPARLADNRLAVQQSQRTADECRDRDGCEPPNFGFVSTFTDVGLVIRKGRAAFRANMVSTLRWLCELNRGRSRRPTRYPSSRTGVWGASSWLDGLYSGVACSQVRPQPGHW